MVAESIGRRSLLKGGLSAAALSVGAIAAGSALTGCAPSSGSAEPLQFWQFYAPAPQQTGPLVQQSKWFMDAVSSWNTKNSQQVKPVFIPAYTNPANTRLATAFAANAGPDIFLLSPGDFLRYYNGDALLDLAPYMSKEAIDDFYPEAIATRKVGEGIYGLPMEIEPLALIYNQKSFERAGLSEADVPKTWEQMLDVGEKLSTNSQSGLVLEVVPGYYQNFTFYPWLWQGKGDVVDPATQRPQLAGAAFQNALELFGQSIKRGISPRTLPANGDLPVAFKSGYAAMWQSGIWQLAAFKQETPDLPYGIAPLPTPDGGEPRTILGGWAWVVNKHGRNPEAAAKFVVETMGSMSEESVKRVADWCFGAKSDMSPRKSSEKLMAANGAFEESHMKIFKELILPTGRGEPRFPPVVYKTVSNAIQAVQLAGASAASQAEAAQQALEAYLANYRGAPLL